MLIKSHTGATVGLREKMAISIREVIAFNPETVFRDIIKIVDRITDDAVVFTDGSWRKHDYIIANAIMLHCPFQVGDELEQKVDDLWQKQAKITEIDKTGGVWCGKNPQVLVSGIRHPINKNIRHANPNLRDAPEFTK